MALKRDKFDDVFSQLVRERTDWICDYCGRTFHHERQKLHTSNPDDTKQPDTIPITPSPTALAVTENSKRTHTNSPRMRRLSMGR